MTTMNKVVIIYHIIFHISRLTFQSFATFGGVCVCVCVCVSHNDFVDTLKFF